MPITAGVTMPTTGLTDAVRDAVDRSRGPSQGGVIDAAGITRAQWQHFLEQYRPVEDELLRRTLDPDLQGEGDQAGLTAAAGVASSRGILARNLSRAGVNLSAEERAALRRRAGTTLTRAVAQAENTTRRGLNEARTNTLRQLVGIGRGVAQTASGGLNAAADMAAQREMLHKQQRAQAHGTNLSAAATAASMLIAFI